MANVRAEPFCLNPGNGNTFHHFPHRVKGWVAHRFHNGIRRITPEYDQHIGGSARQDVADRPRQAIREIKGCLAPAASLLHETVSGKTARAANDVAASRRLAAVIVPVTIWPAWSRAV